MNYLVPDMSDLAEALETQSKYINKHLSEIAFTCAAFVEKFNNELSEPLNRLQKDLLSLSFGLNLTTVKIRLIRHEGNKIIFGSKIKPIKKKDSFHLLLLLALLTRTDENGFLSYQDIDKYFLENGKEKIESEEDSLKRIWNALDALFRFLLGIDKVDEREKWITTIAGKGLQIYNPVI